MPQPNFIQKIDGSSASAHSLTLTFGAATGTANGEILLVGVILNPNGVESAQQVAGIIDSQGTPVVSGVSTGVPVNNWSQLGYSGSGGLRVEWWVCKGAQPITYLTINITGTGATGLQSIIACALEYSGANGVSNPVFQSLQASENTITTQYIEQTVATYPDSNAAIMIGLFAMLNDTFSGTPPTPALSAQTVRSTNSVSIPPALSYQVIEQDTPAQSAILVSGGERVTLATGALNVTAESASQLATALNLGASSMQCFYIVISGGLILNTSPGFSDQPDSSLAAGQFALGSQMAKISGNAALGMCRMEFFQDIYVNGETVALPISPVDGYQYQMNELVFIWGIYSTADVNNGWITGPEALWFCNWDVDQETGLVSCTEWYRADGNKGVSNDGHLIVTTVAQRQMQTLTVAATPSWTQLQASTFVTDLPYATNYLTEMNDDSKFAVIAQECIPMGLYVNGATVPVPISPADDYQYSYAETTFVFSWAFTTLNTDTEMVPLPCPPYYTLASLNAAINASTGAVTCAVGMMGDGGENYTNYTTLGAIQVFALTRRSRTGTPAVVANQFAEISNTLFYPGMKLPAGIGAQVVNNINEAANTPEYFGPTLYALGQVIPLPVSPVDGYEYQASECTCIYEWGQMTPGPWPPSSGSNNRTALFSAQINAQAGAAGVIANSSVTSGGITTYTSVIWRLEPGGPYDPETSPGGSGNVEVMVLVVGSRSAQQSEINNYGSTPPSDTGTTTADQLAAGPITVNGV